MIKTIPAGRMQLSQLAPRPYAAMIKLEASIEFAQHLRELVKLRASQMNGCAFCIDMHWKGARAAGESEARLYGLDTWRESLLYSERERAALALCEAMSLVADGHVPDEVWERARAAFEEPELSQLRRWPHRWRHVAARCGRASPGSTSSGAKSSPQTHLGVHFEGEDTPRGLVSSGADMRWFG